jgi:hypothetical protein
MAIEVAGHVAPPAPAAVAGVPVEVAGTSVPSLSICSSGWMDRPPALAPPEAEADPEAAAEPDAAALVVDPLSVDFDPQAASVRAATAANPTTAVLTERRCTCHLRRFCSPVAIRLCPTGVDVADTRGTYPTDGSRHRIYEPS